MGIKQFNDDAKAAIEAAKRGELPDVSNLRKGESDGEIAFTYTYPHHSSISKPCQQSRKHTPDIQAS